MKRHMIETNRFKKNVAIGCLILTSSFAMANRPNIIFLEVDDLNYKFMSASGSTLLETPHIDSLARTGVYFENAMCQGMMCGPSRNSLVSGLLPHSMGFYRNGQMRALPKGCWTFPRALQEAGYYTAYVGKSHIRTGGPGTLASGVGLDFVRSTAGRAVLMSNVKKGKDQSGDWYFKHLESQGLVQQFIDDASKPSTLPEDDYLDGLFTKTTLDLIDQYNEDKPFFIWLNYSLPHGPHDVNKEYHTFLPDDMPGIQKASFTPPPKLIKDTKPAKPTMKKTQAEYCGAITFLDRQIGRILENLRENEKLDNTVVVLFSDHGIMMGDHELIHKGTLFRQITTPTLLVSWPKGFKQGQVVKHPVELMDLIPTTLDLAGALKWDTRPIKAGESLRPFLTGEGTFKRKLAFGEVESYVAAVDGHYRLIRGEGHNLLFDDINDPDNLINIAEQHPARVAQLTTAIDQWLKTTGPVRPAGFYKAN
jgi:arylsulfatase A-like enzyme